MLKVLNLTPHRCLINVSIINQCEYLIVVFVFGLCVIFHMLLSIYLQIFFVLTVFLLSLALELEWWLQTCRMRQYCGNVILDMNTE